MLRGIGTFLRRDDAATAVEYAVMLALILLVCFAAIALLGQNTGQMWTSNNNNLKAVNFGS